MNKAPWILASIFMALFLSWYGMVWGPASQQNGLLVHVSGETVYPRDRAGLAKQGAEIYRANGQTLGDVSRFRIHCTTINFSH